MPAIAATNHDLTRLAHEGKFRQDLFFRLTVVTIKLPPLCERREDILPLALDFLEQFCREAVCHTLKLSEWTKLRLQSHDWTGNVHELRNLMERLAFLCPVEEIQPEGLEFILVQPAGPGQSDVPPGLNLGDAMQRFQRAYIEQALERPGGNQAEAARMPGLHRSNLHRKIRQLDMNL